MRYRWPIIISLLATSFNLSAKVKFSQWELEADFKITHPPAVLNLLGEEHEQIVLFGEDAEKKRMMTVYQLKHDDSNADVKHHYQPIATTTIPDNFLAYDLLKSDKTDKLVFRTNQGIYEYSPQQQSFKLVVNTNSIYLRPKAQYLASHDFVKDVNNDELGDIIITDFHHTNLFIQSKDGSFQHQKIPVKPKVNLASQSATYTETPLYFADLTLDQKSDLVIVKDSSLLVYPQNGSGIFEEEPQNLVIPIDVKALNWWEIKESDGESMDQNALSYRTMSKIIDINNDNIVDLLVRYSQTDGVLDRQNNYEIYLGRQVDGKIDFSAEPDSTLQVDGTTIGVDMIDIDGDKRSEVVLASLDIGVTQIIGALLSGSIDQDIYVYQLDEEDKYSEDPSYSRDVELNFSLSSGKSGEPVVKVADFNGDGLHDMMTSSGEKTLRIYRGTQKKNRVFRRKSDRHRVLLPKDGSYVETKDLNKDGKQDVIIRYGRQDDESLSNKLVVLFAY